jgi:hypothetical protein
LIAAPQTLETRVLSKFPSKTNSSPSEEDWEAMVQPALADIAGSSN